MWKLTPKLNNSVLTKKFYCYLYFLNFLQISFKKYFIKNIFDYKWFFNQTNYLELETKLKNIMYNSYSVKPSLKIGKKLNNKIFQKTLWKKTLITSFLYINTWIPTPTLTVHASFNIIYFFNNHSNVGVFNLKKIFQIWTNLLIFLKNLFFFNLNYLFFSSSYFKYESLALNWTKNKSLKYLWKYTNPFIFFLNNKTTLRNDIYFRWLSKKMIKLAFVIDIYYHKRTLHYLNKYKFVTIGPVPISSNFYTLFIAAPVSSNLVFSNLFFIRLLFKLNKLSYRDKYLQYKSFC